MAPIPRVFSTRHLRVALYTLCAILTIIILIITCHKWQLDGEANLQCFMDFEPTNLPIVAENEVESDLPKPLGDVLLTQPQPKPGRSIFFLETNCISGTKHHPLELTARQTCAIESAAKHNPNFQVFVLFASPRYQQKEGEQPLIDAILSYPNVQLRQLNLMRFAVGTPIEDWLKDGKLFKSDYPIVHISDLLRLLTLYRFGGIYLDLDVVLLRSLEQVPLNFAGAESDTHVANGVLSLAPTDFGHQFATSCLREFQQHFDGGDWGNNGPGVVTRVAKRICATQSIEVMQTDPKRCMGFKVFNRSTFYEVGWVDWRHFFEPQYMEQTLQRTKDSLLIHVWNKHSHQMPIKVGSETAYGKYAEQNCPKAYAAAGEYF
ncbi:lactosylceramide 4-alpha-galactosyltransferase-like [Drosophila sulfurigaster albostrigata]|uniref:lactosylceramide 4-alpha-galactosyltransferase-like n=1 Tax=Drosophila sulfurigaster albostrigata TaxID=89887 RepID=UPI002D21BAA3|nr:lactosylceramide 4-alpha-galactosyltransferase-like [Drosophila sulfurigaster albostrigata]